MASTGTGPLSPDELTEWYAVPADRAVGTWVRAGFITTLDGRVTGPDGTSSSLNEGSAADAAVFQHLREWADVVVVGAGTARAESYPPLPGLPLVVVSASGGLPPSLGGGVEGAAGEVVLVGGRGRPVPPQEVLAVCADRGWRRVVLEGGPMLLATWLEAGVVDELCVTVRPVLAGGGGPLLVGPHVQLDGLAGEPTHLLLWDGDLLVRTRLR